MEKDDFCYIILKNSYDNLTCKTSVLPVISKFKKDEHISFQFDKRDGEGPFNSLYELKRKSLAYAGISKQKDRQKVLKPKNIQEIKEFLFTKEDTSIDINYFNSLTHITIGRIKNKEVKGVHFFNSDKVRIKEVISKNISTGVYSAKIECLNKNTLEWIEKKDITTFFPDTWTTSLLFIECNYAFERKKKIADRVYTSNTLSGIKVQFIIDNENKILTFYPILEVE